MFGIRCPYLGCKNELYEKDIELLVERGVLAAPLGKQLAELRKQNYTARLEGFTDEMQPLTADDYKFMKKLWACTRRCPRCSVIIEKSEGCNDFGCICGHRFNFAKAPRGCGDGVADFGSVISLAADFDMALKDAMQQVQKAQSKGIEKYQRVLSTANGKQLPPEAAELHVQAELRQPAALAQLRAHRHERRVAKTVQLLVQTLGYSLQVASAIVQQAEKGDQAAWAKIREAKQSKASSR